MGVGEGAGAGRPERPVSLRNAAGQGYPDEDIQPLTDTERAALARRNALEPPDAGRRKKGPPNMRSHTAAPDTMRSVGLEEEDGCSS